MLSWLQPWAYLLAIESVMKSVMVLTAVLTFTWFLRRASAAMRHLVLMVGVISLLALPVASALAPSWNLGILPIHRSFLAGPAPSIESETGVVSTPQPGMDRTALHDQTTESLPLASVKFTSVDWLLLVWSVVSVILLARLLGGKWHWYRLVKRAQDLRDRKLAAFIRNIATELGINRKIVIKQSDQFRIPFVAGIVRPHLAIPKTASAWPAERSRTVLYHEFAHIKRRDILIQFLAQVGCCFFWINPLVWILERRLLIERERACDDVVLGMEIHASEYAGHLMEVMKELATRQKYVWAMTTMAEGTDFKDRIVSLLNPAALRRAPRPKQVQLLTFTALLLLLPLFMANPWQLDMPSMGALNETETQLELSAQDLKRIKAIPVLSTDSLYRSEIDQYIKLLRSTTSADMREHIATLLGERGAVEAVEPLIETLDDPDAKVREHVASALGNLGDPRAIMPLIDVLQNDPDEDVREHAASALGKLDDTRATMPLIKRVLIDPDSEVREHATSTLSGLGDVRAIIPLINTLRDDPDADVREHVATTLGELGDARAVNPLLNALRNDPDMSVREHAASAMGRIGGEGVYELLLEEYEKNASGEPRVQAHILFALASTGGDRAIDLLLEGLSHKEAIIRAHAAMGLGICGNPSVTRALRRALRDPSRLVREQAQQALDQLKQR